MSEDKELKTKAPVYIRDCIEGRRSWTEFSSASYCSGESGLFRFMFVLSLFEEGQNYPMN